jgi:hypothetical protein
MSLKHNKKRNAGLLNEFFARYMAKAIVEKRDGDLEKAKELFTKHFHQGTDLHRELKMFTALFETRLASRDAAVSLIQQVKQGCKLQSQAKIDLEKSALLHEINLYLDDPNFFDQEIPEYRDYATIQVLMNHWRGGLLTEHLSESAQLEDKLIQSITSKSDTKPKTNVLEMTNQDVDGLVVNLMTEKLNKKYNTALNENQKKILQLYVFSKDDQEAKTTLVEFLEGMRQKVLSGITRTIDTDKDIKSVESKLLEVKAMLQEDFRDTSKLNDQMVTFYMTVSKLEEELTNV